MMSNPPEINVRPTRKALQRDGAKEEATGITTATMGFITDGGASDVSDTEIEDQEVAGPPTTTERRRRQNAKFEAWFVEP